MAFTRRHYIQIAAMLAWERVKVETEYDKRADASFATIERRAANEAIDSIGNNLAGMFGDDNPNFDARRFHLAAHNLSGREVTS